MKWHPNLANSYKDLNGSMIKWDRKKLSVQFNQTCLKEKMLPIYIYIYMRTHTKVVGCRKVIKQSPPKGGLRTMKYTQFYILIYFSTFFQKK